MDSRNRLATWEPLTLLQGRKFIESKRVFDGKRDREGKRVMLKERLVAKGFT